MTLDNSAKIGDIITALEGMQAINQKAELASVIGSPATATDNIATQITKIQDAKDVFAEKIGVENTKPLLDMANDLSLGKNFSDGVITASSTTLTFRQISTGTGANSYYVEFTGLLFKPSYIIIEGNEGSTNGALSCYRADIGGLGEGVTTTAHYLATGSYSNYVVNDTANAYVTNSGFLLPVAKAGNYTWIAFE